MASIENRSSSNNVPRLTPDSEVVISSLGGGMQCQNPSPVQREGGRIRSDPIDRASSQSQSQALSQSLPQSATWTTTVTAAAEESWIQQSLAMPSATNEASLAPIINECRSGTIQTTGRNETNISTSIPHHRRERSLDSVCVTGLFGPTQTQWAAHANALSEHNNSDDAGISVAPPTRTSSVNSNTSNPYFNLNSWGSNSFGNSDSGFDPMMFTTSFSSTDEDTSGIPSDIHDAARIFNWKMVAELCETKPEAAAYIGEDGWTALHHACNRRCPDPNIMESLIRAYPDALLITEDKGWTPLHYASRFKAPKDVVQLLLYLYPEKGRVGAKRPDRRGRLPLYYAVRYSAPTGVVGLLLEVDPSAVLEEDQNADSPLALIWDDWAEKLDGRKDILKILVGEEASKKSEILMNNIGTICFEMNKASGIEDRIEKAKLVKKRLQRQTHVLERWNKVNIFLKAAFGFPWNEGCDLDDNARLEEEEKKDTQEEYSWRVLHAISAIKCHSSLFLLAMCLHPEQAFELDRNDLKRIDTIYKSEDSIKLNPSNLTALHLAASSHASGDSGKMVLTQLLALNPSAAKYVDTEKSTPLHRISGNKSKSNWNLDAVENVYGCHETAITMVDANGRLPLHRASSTITYYNTKVEDDAVMSRSKICRLLHEHVDAANHSDNFGCLPLHLVAKNGRTWDVQVQTLHDANTAAVRARTGVKFCNRLPLHLAAANANSDFSMISNFIKYNPIGASQADRKGLFPLHLACESGHSWEVIHSIHQAFSGAVVHTEQNNRGWNALHMAASSEHSNGELLSELVNLYPKAATVCDNDGRYPLHLACMSGKLWENGLSSLFEANANAIRCRDNEGLLPLHIVAFRNLKPPVTCDSSPKITNRSRRSKSSTALEMDQNTKKEKREAQELSNIFEILKSDPTALIA